MESELTVQSSNTGCYASEIARVTQFIYLSTLID